LKEKKSSRMHGLNNTVTVTVEQLRHLFEPSSIAVIGASRTPGKIGYEALKNVMVWGYKGKVYAVNPNADEVLGLRCYRSIKDIKEHIDLALIVVPAELVASAIEECGQKGVCCAVVISSGFKEIGEAGEKLARDVLAVARKYSVRMLGPNTMGFKNPIDNLDASFAFGMPACGKISVVSQSGALSIGMIYHAILEKIGLSKVIGVGNKLDIDEADLIEYLHYDKNTDIIAMYLESVSNGKKFLNAAKRCRKPIVIIKAGRTKAGAQAAASHTGALAGRDAVYDGVFKQANVYRVGDVTELFDVSHALAQQPPAMGNRIGVVTNGGGAGILIADGLVENGMEVPKLSPKTLAQLKKILPPLVIPGNPADLVADASFYRYEASAHAVLDDPVIDGIIVVCVQGGYARPREYAGAMEKLFYEQRAEGGKKPIMGCWIGGTEISEVIDQLKEENIPIYPDTSRVVKAMAAIVREGQRLGKARR
jgi:acetyl coenzyme A synthetase (ADP forming)-like protein